jgi:hypothetical protein
MSNKFLTICFSVCLFCLAAYSENAAYETDYFSSNPFYNGDLQLSLDNPAYAPGENVSASFVASNLENFSIVDAFVVVHLVSGGPEHIYPTHLSDEDNVFYEDVLTGVNLGPFESKSINYSYLLPEDLKPGTYRLEAYLETERTPVTGMAEIFLAPASRAFTVDGAGVFPLIKILRNATIFNNMSGPVGVPAPPDSPVKGEVFFQSAASADLEGFRLAVTVCDWQDMVCPKDAILFQKIYDAPALAPGASGKLEVSFNAPSAPGAYSVRLEMLDKSGKMHSLYRSRVVVVGGTGKIRKMAVDPIYLEKGDTGRILLLTGASPDHYTYPWVGNVTVSATIADRSGSEVFSGSHIIENLSSENNGGLVPVFLNFSVSRELAWYRLCSRIYSGGKLLDMYCYDIDPSKYSIPKRQVFMNVSWDFRPGAGELAVNACPQDARGKTIQSNLTLLLIYPENNSAEYADVLTPPCAVRIFNASFGRYSLAVNDLDSGKQYNYDLNLTEKMPEEPRAICGDSVCAKVEGPETCCLDCGCPADMICGAGGCSSVESPVSSSTTLASSTKAGGADIIYYCVAFIVFLVAVTYLLFKSGWRGGGLQ